VSCLAKALCNIASSLASVESGNRAQNNFFSLLKLFCGFACTGATVSEGDVVQTSREETGPG
jgi:hypothetical protein